MRIKVDYEECKICDNNQSCDLFDEMKALVAKTVETLHQMTTALDHQSYSDEVHA